MDLKMVNWSAFWQEIFTVMFRDLNDGTVSGDEAWVGSKEQTGDSKAPRDSLGGSHYDPSACGDNENRSQEEQEPLSRRDVAAARAPGLAPGGRGAGEGTGGWRSAADGE